MRTVWLIVFLVGVTAAPAGAHRFPADCTQSGVSFQLSGLFASRNGDRVTVTPYVGNNQVPGACQVDDATVTLMFPKSDGTDNGREVTVVTNLDMLAGESLTAYDPVSHTVDFDAGVFRGWATLAINGTVHNFEGHTPGFISSLGSPLYITRPHISLTVSPDVTSGEAGTVTYTYTAENDTLLDPEPGAFSPGAFNVELTDDKCSSPSLLGGDANLNSQLDRGETWTYTCTTSLSSSSSLNNVVLTGISSTDGRPWPRTRARGGICGGLPATIVGTDARNRLQGTGRRDVIVAGGGNDVVNARGGNDLVCGGIGADVLRGEGGRDVLRGEAGPDRLVGGAGTDTLIGGPGADSQQQ